MRVLTTQATGTGKNLLINACFRINQRGYVSGTATAAANEYTLDRWRVVVSGENITFPELAVDNTVTCPAGGLAQEVEGANIYGGEYVVSWEGSAVCSVAGVVREKGEKFNLSGSVDCVVLFSGGTVVRPILQAGAVAREFYYRAISEELVLSKRFYELLSLPNNSIKAMYSSVSTRFSGVAHVWEVEKRVVPAIQLESSYGAFYWSVPAFAAYSENSTAGISISGQTKNAFKVYQTRQVGGSEPVSGQVYSLQASSEWSIDAEM